MWPDLGPSQQPPTLPEAPAQRPALPGPYLGPSQQPQTAPAQRQSAAPPQAGAAVAPRRMAAAQLPGAPKVMNLADVAEAMRQTGRSRREVEAAARARGYTVYGSALELPSALA